MKARLGAGRANLQRADNQINRHDVAGIPDDRAQVKHLVKLEPAGDGIRGYRPKCVSVLACVPLWRWAFLLFELYGRGTRGRPECVSGMAGQALRHNG